MPYSQNSLVHLILTHIHDKHYRFFSLTITIHAIFFPTTITILARNISVAKTCRAWDFATTITSFTFFSYSPLPITIGAFKNT